MHRRKFQGACAAAVLACLLAVTGVTGQSPVPGNGVFPGKDWQRLEKPEAIGYLSARLAALRAWLQSLDTTAMMVSVGGRSLFEYGDLTRLSYLASVRKSVLAILYGKYVENGTISLKKTLKELEFTDVGGLTPQELEVNVEHLLTARSGVYHPAGCTRRPGFASSS